MHTVVLLAIFGFTAVVGMLVMARLAVGAALGLVVAVAWPATLVSDDYPLRSGALALLGVLAILFLLRRDEPARGVPQAAGIGLVLIVLAVLASTTDAVAKPAFLSWRTWDPYDRPTEPVSVDYVWSANYDGIQFPEKPTTVLRVKVPGLKRSLYWRATTLDDYTGLIWDEDIQLGEASERDQIDASGPLLPEAAHDEENWVRQEFTIEALRDTRLLASAQPVRWEPGTDAPVADANGEVVVVPDGIRQDQHYTVWSYVPRPNPSELNAFRGNYPPEASRYLEIAYEPVPAWGVENRDTLMRVFLRSPDEFEISALESVYEAALGVTSQAQSPYEAAALLETWFREAGGFTYDEQPPAPIGGTPALVDFINETKRGYCQHYAGAMALMLRLLGIPSRVAEGFTSGQYSADDKEWVVKDTNAHAWVEVWFPDFGWIPFDPTPGRGELDATYAVSSQRVQRRRRGADRLRRPARRHLPGARRTDPDGCSPPGPGGRQARRWDERHPHRRPRPRAQPLRAPRARDRRRHRGRARAEGDQTQREVRDARPARPRFGLPPRHRRLPRRPGHRPLAERDAAGDRRDAPALLLDRRDALRPRPYRRPLRAAGEGRRSASPRAARPPPGPAEPSRATRRRQPGSRLDQPPFALDLGPRPPARPALGRPNSFPYGEKQA